MSEDKQILVSYKLFKNDDSFSVYNVIVIRDVIVSTSAKCGNS